jgi:glycerophosphoryl diester phosphodiesterase
MIAAFHDAGVEIHIWTVDDPARIRTLLDAGVDGIMSDRCDIAMDVVARR